MKDRTQSDRRRDVSSDAGADSAAGPTEVMDRASVSIEFPAGAAAEDASEVQAEPETFEVVNVSATLLSLSDGSPFPSRSKLKLGHAEIERLRAIEGERGETFISIL